MRPPPCLAGLLCGLLVRVAAPEASAASGSQVVPVSAVASYPDHRLAAKYRLDATDAGVIVRHGDGLGDCDKLGAREALIFEENGVYHLFYDGAGPKGWLACLATSTNLSMWVKRGPVLDFGKPGAPDSAAACSPWFFQDAGAWHMFYLGTPQVSPDPQWRAPAGALLALGVRSEQANKLVVGLDAFAVEVSLTGGAAWQAVALKPSDFHDAEGKPCADLTGLKELRLGAQETLRMKGDKGTAKAFGGAWKGAAPEFRDLRWIEPDGGVDRE